MMMDAAPVIDFTDPNEVDAQLTALYDSVESNLDSEVSSHATELKTSSGLILNETSGDALSNVSDFLKDVGDNVKSDISQAFALAKSEAQNALAAINAELEV